jgi:hypothetical protein
MQKNKKSVMIYGFERDEVPEVVKASRSLYQDFTDHDPHLLRDPITA